MSTVVQPKTAFSRLELVVAVARNGVIGRGNTLPWRLPDDLAFFKRTTMGHAILMGRRTWDSIGRALPGRRNLVLTRDPARIGPGAEAVESIDEALGCAGGTALMVIGGGELYRACLARASAIHLTDVDADVEGDVYFPELDAQHWRETWSEHHPADARHAYPFTFRTLECRSAAPLG